MNRALWIVQIALAFVFASVGTMKVATPYPDLAAQWHWAAQSPPWLVRFIGVSELLGAAGLILPGLTRIATWLTPVAAVGLLTIVSLAVVTHLSLGEPERAWLPAALALLTAFVAWGRFRAEPLSGRAPVPPVG